MSGTWDLLTAAQRRGLDEGLRRLGADEADIVDRLHQTADDLTEVLVAKLRDGRQVMVRQDGTVLTLGLPA